MFKDPKRETPLIVQIDTSTLNFKPNKVTETLSELFGKAYCYVCFTFHGLKNQRKSPLYEKEKEMLVCYGCRTTVHHSCYGMKTTAYNEVITERGDKIKMFVCDKCRDVGPDIIKECGICYQHIGAFRKASNGTYVHLTCALFSDLYSIDNFENMTIKYSPEFENQDQAQNKHCDYCGRIEGLFTCSTKDCNESVHIYCGFLNKMGFLVDNEETLEGWAIRIYKDGNTPSLKFDCNDPNILNIAKSLYKKAMTTLNGSANGENEQLLTKKYDEFKVKVSQVLNSMPADASPRGGSMTLECQKHRTPELFCICHLPYDYMRFMVGCDSCDNWFHCTCLDLTEDQASELHTYFCKKCKQWSGLKQNILRKDDTQMEEEHPCKTIDKFGVIPKDTSRFTILDFLMVCIMLQKRSLIKSETFEDFKSYIEALLESAKYVPFNLNAFMSDALTRYFFARTIDSVIFARVSFEDLKKVKGAFNPATRKSEQSDLSKLRDMHNYFNSLARIYIENNLPKTSLSMKLEYAASTLQWHISFNESISNQDTRPSLPVLDRLISQAQRLKMDQELPELVFLRDLQTKTAAWTSVAEKFVGGRRINFHGKAFDFENLQQVPLAKALEILDQTLEAVKSSLKLKPGLGELKEIVDKGEELGIDLPEEKGSLGVKYTRAKEAQEKLQGTVSTFDDLNEKLRDFGDLIVSSPEMLKFLDLYHKAKLVQLKLKFYAKAVSNLHNAKKHKKMEEEDDEDEGKHHHHVPEGETFTLEELEGGLREAEELELDFGGDHAVVRSAVGQIKEFKEKAKDIMDKVVPVAQLKALTKESNQFNVRFPELTEMKQKGEIHGEIKGLLHKPCTPEQLAQAFQKLEKHFEDAKLQTSLETKLIKGKDLEETAARLLAQTNFSKNDVNNTVHSLLSDLKTQKIDIAQKEELAYIPKSFKWLEKIFSFYQKYIPEVIEAEQNNHKAEKMETEEDNGKKEYEITEHRKEETSIESIDFMVSCCLAKDENVLKSVQKHFTAYKNLVKEGQNITHLDERIKRIFSLHGTIYWSIEATSLLEKQVIKGDDLETFYKMGQQYKVNISDETYLKFIQLYEGHKKWLNDYQVLTDSEEFTKLLQEPIDEVLKDKLKKLLDEYDTLHVQLETEYNHLKNAWDLIEWVKKTRQVIGSVAQGQKITFESIQELVSLADSLQVPKDNGLSVEIKELFQSQQNLRESYIGFYQSKHQVQEKIDKINTTTDPKDRKKELSDLNPLKPHLKQAVELLASIQSSTLLFPSEEIDAINREIEKTESWNKQAKEFLEKYPVNFEEPFPSELNSTIMNSLTGLKNEMGSLILQDESTEQRLHEFEWTFHAHLLVTKKGQKKSPVKIWKNLIKLAQKFKDSVLLQTNLYKTIQEQVEIYDIVALKISNLKDQEQALIAAIKGSKIDFANTRKGLKDEAAVEKMLNDIEECQVGMPEEKRYIEEILAKGKKALESYKKVAMSEEKVAMDLFKMTVEQFRRLPFRYVDEEKILEDYLNEVKQLLNLLQDWRNQGRYSKINTKLAETIYKKYTDCPVLLPEVAKIAKMYSDVVEKVQQIEDTLRGSASETIPFEDLLTMTRDLDDMKLDLGPRVEEVKRKLWLIKIDSFKAFKEKKIVPSNPVSFAFLKNCLSEGYDLLTSNEAIKEVREGLGYLEELIKEIESHLNDLYNIKDPQILEEISYTLFDFVDLREEIIDYKAQVSTANDYRPQLVSSVQDLAKKDDQEILNITKKRERMQTEETKQVIRDLTSLKREKDKDKQKEKDKEKRLLSPSKSNLGKRKMGPKQTDDSTYDFLNESVTKKDSTKLPIVKKIKTNTGPVELKKATSQQSTGQPGKSVASGQPGQPGEVQAVKKEKVDEDVRAEAKRRFAGVLKSNPHFNKVAEEFKNIVRLLEMNLFSDFHNDKAKYNQKVQSVVMLLAKLKDYRLISKRVMDKEFDFTVIQKLMTSNLDELEKSAAQHSKNTSKPVPGKDQSSKHSGSFESSLQTLLSGTQTESSQSDFSKIKSIMGGGSGSQQLKPAREPKPESSLLQKMQQHSFLEELSDDEAQKKISTRPESVKMSADEEFGAGYFSGEDAEKKDNNTGVTTPVKPAQSTLSGAAGSVESSAQKKNLTPYNPSAVKSEDEGSAYDPLRDYNPVTTPAPVALPKYERGAILRIFKGKIRHNMINKEVFTSIRGCTMETCDYCDDVRCFPKIPEDLRVSGRVSQAEAIDYINKLYYKQSRDPIRKQLIVGWVYNKKEHQESLQAVCQELLDREKVAVSKYSESATIYFLHPSVINKDLIRKLGWKVRTIDGQVPPKVFLLFVLYIRGSAPPAISASSIEPELVGMPKRQEPVETPQLQQQQQQQSASKMEVEKKAAMSPITSDEEEAAENPIIANDQFTDLLDLIEADPDLQDIKQTEEIPQRTEPMQEEVKEHTELSQQQIPVMNIPSELNIVNQATVPMQVEEKNLLSDLGLEGDEKTIIERLQKMGREELCDLINIASEEQKEKIISILNNVVEEDENKPEEENYGKLMEQDEFNINPAQYQQQQQQQQGDPQYQQYQGYNQSQYGQRPFQLGGRQQRFMDQNQQQPRFFTNQQQGYYHKGTGHGYQGHNQGQNRGANMQGQAGYPGFIPQQQHQQNRPGMHHGQPGMQGQFYKRGQMRRGGPRGYGMQGRPQEFGHNQPRPGGDYGDFDNQNRGMGNMEDDTRRKTSENSASSGQDGSNATPGGGYDRYTQNQ